MPMSRECLARDPTATVEGGRTAACAVNTPLQKVPVADRCIWWSYSCHQVPPSIVRPCDVCKGSGCRLCCPLTILCTTRLPLALLSCACGLLEVACLARFELCVQHNGSAAGVPIVKYLYGVVVPRTGVTSTEVSVQQLLVFRRCHDM